MPINDGMQRRFSSPPRASLPGTASSSPIPIYRSITPDSTMPLLIPKGPTVPGEFPSVPKSTSLPPSEKGEDMIAVHGLAPSLTKDNGHDATALEKVRLPTLTHR